MGGLGWRIGERDRLVKGDAGLVLATKLEEKARLWRPKKWK